MIGVYKITYLPTKEFYIGSSTDIERRWHEHTKCIKHKNKLDCGWVFNKEINFEDFNFEILEICDIDYLHEKEEYWFNELNSTLCKNFKNPLNRGYHKNTNPAVGKHWYTNGEKEVLAYEQDCPDGWKQGRKQSSVENMLNMNVGGQKGIKHEKPISQYIDCSDMDIKILSNNEYIPLRGIIKNNKTASLPILFVTYLQNSKERTVKLTIDHPLHTNRGRIKAEDLTLNDKLIDTITGEYYDIISINKTNNKHITYDVETDNDMFDLSGVLSHNCRTLMGYDRHGLGYVRKGRGNNVPNTIILPKIAIENGICLGERTEPDLEGFWKDLDRALRICEQGLLERYAIIKRQSPKAAPFMYQNNTIKGARDCDETVEEAVKHGTLGIGLIGIAEMCKALFGKTHDEDEEVHKFALSVVEHIYNYAKEASERNDLNFGCYFTPAESLCYTALKALREQYGVIEDVTSHEFLTNSCHVPVWHKVSIYDKLKCEAPFTKYATSGCITYLETDATFVKNTKAVEKIIDYAFDLDIPYLAFNFPIDSCGDCGHQGEFNDCCSECGSKNIQQLRRVTGYLTTTYKNFNPGKQAEVEERVKHSVYTDMSK